MKNKFNRILTILILMIFAIEIVLPKMALATGEDEYETKEFVPRETAWYRSNYDNEAYLEGTSTTIADRVEYYKKIYYIENGSKKMPSVDNVNPSVYLTKGKKYYIPTEGWWGDASATLQKTISEAKVDDTTITAKIANFIFSALGNGIHWLIGKALGRTVTIDDIVFNNYPETNISFFDSIDEIGTENASTLIYGTNGVGGLDSVINEWYAIFRQIALIGYMMILVYMGIRILLSASPDAKADYKKFFMDWVIGITILMLFPYAMKYIIDINEAMVETIEANKGYEDTTSSSLKNVDYEKNAVGISIDDEIDWSTGTDYMSKVAYAAKVLQQPALSFTFIIMTWQLFVLVIHYYKRLFIIAFLIIIFPLVALSYAIDKIADGKSQALNTWIKEFMINVFVQTFHAIVYVFCCSTVYSAAGINSSELGFDFILIIVGVTFLFKGEAIIRQIFGQVSKAGTMRNLSDSAALTFAKISVAQKAIKKTTDYTIGKKSVPRKLAKGAKDIKAINARIGSFDKTKKRQQDINPGLRLEGAPKPPDENASEAEKQNFLEERDIFNAAATLNNPNTHSYEEKAMALNKLKELAKTNPDHAVFKSSNLSAAQLNAMSSIDEDIGDMLASGMSRVEIERKVEMRMFRILPEETKDKRKDIMRTYYTGLFLDGSNGAKNVSKSNVRRNVNETLEAIRREEDDIKFGRKRNKSRDEIEREADEISSRYIEKRGDSLTDAEKQEITEMAKDIVILNRRKYGEFTSDELLRTVNNVRQHAYDSEAIAEMVTTSLDSEVDIDALAHIMAKKDMAETGEGQRKSRHYQLASEIVYDYEQDSRDGYFEDEVSIHDIIAAKDTREELDRIVDEAYTGKKAAMQEEVEEFAKQYLVDREIDIMEGSYDTTLELQDGLTLDELKLLKAQAIMQTLSNVGAVTKEKADIGGLSGFAALIAEEQLKRSEERRTGIHEVIEEPESVSKLVKQLPRRLKEFERRLERTGTDIVEDRVREREKIQDKHFYGDIGKNK